MSAAEWLVCDSYGAFAMGTPAGVRTRKYHGFFQGIPGRSERAFLTDFELKLNGRALWPHRYEAPEGTVVDPNPLAAAVAFVYQHTPEGPRWTWEFPEGNLHFGVEAPLGGGIKLGWKWQAGSAGKGILLEIRPLWGMRPLHGVGGETWTIEFQNQLATIVGQSGVRAECLLEGPFKWKDDPLWYRQFHYSEEALRGYVAREDLYSAGVFTVELTAAGPASACFWVLAENARELRRAPAEKLPREKLPYRPAALDFVLKEPAGIVAGYPWFGEWGRDTFISLPGIAMAWLEAGGDPTEVWDWAREILLRWGEWIRMTGMIPNMIEQGGSHQWESADGTLWWCHALAGLWSFSLGRPGLFPGIEKQFLELLTTAISSMGQGRHLFLRPTEQGLLEVTEPHATWMDAQVDSAPVTPRLGILPEINALWFQARCLHWLWSGSSNGNEIERLGRRVLLCNEADRPNVVFLHSIPLAPSFVLKDSRILTAHLEELGEYLWTPVGLRTLSPQNPAYRPHCVGDQTARDLAYHQGPPWAWLGGHYEMARQRKNVCAEASEKMPTGPILGHVPELFDAEWPFVPRGTPAQAWSVACFEEASARQKVKVDSTLTRLVAQRGLARMDPHAGRLEKAN